MKFLTALTLIALAAAAPLQGTGYFEVELSNGRDFLVMVQSGQLFANSRTKSLFLAENDCVSDQDPRIVRYIGVAVDHGLHLVINKQQNIVVRETEDEPVDYGNLRQFDPFSYLEVNGDKNFIFCPDGRIQFKGNCENGEPARLRFHPQL